MEQSLRLQTRMRLAQDLVSSTSIIFLDWTAAVCSADKQPSLEEESQFVCQAVAESAEAGQAGEALQCCPSSRAFADTAC